MKVWTRNPDGEYNECSAEINGKKVTIYSDSSEYEWYYYVDDGESNKLDATSLESAKREVERLEK
jgi:hypothetical protein